MSSEPKVGRRVDESETFDFWRDMQPGDYGKSLHNQWWLRAPDGSWGTLNLDRWHTVEEHEDGTITVRPSVDYTREILGGFATPDNHHLDFIVGESRRRIGWHGWLERGIWREA